MIWDNALTNQWKVHDNERNMDSETSNAESQTERPRAVQLSSWFLYIFVEFLLIVVACAYFSDKIAMWVRRAPMDDAGSEVSAVGGEGEFYDLQIPPTALELNNPLMYSTKSVVIPSALHKDRWENGFMPTFSILPKSALKLCPNRAKRRWPDEELALYIGHPKHVNQSAEVLFHAENQMFHLLKHVPTREVEAVAYLDSLPVRSPLNPHFVWAHWFSLDATCAVYRIRTQEPAFYPSDIDICVRAKKALFERDDVYYISYDLANNLLRWDNATVKGVTVAPGTQQSWPPTSYQFDRKIMAKYHLTFRGSQSTGFLHHNSVRLRLKMAFRNMSAIDPRVQVHVATHWRDFANSTTPIPDYEDLMNSSFVLVPHGDVRWNFRFTEVVFACSIPVIMADGLTLPYEQLIDWSVASIRIPERFASDAQAILDHLPRSPYIIQQMRRNVCEIRDVIFAPEGALEDALLKSIGVILQQNRNKAGINYDRTAV